MTAVLASPSLYEFTGGQAPTEDELTRRYTVQTRGHSADGRQGWLNWTVTEIDSGNPVGYVQATLEQLPGGGYAADIAWVIGGAFQRRGYATEASAAMVAWLTRRDVQLLRANIHPQNTASERIAQALNLTLTEQWQDGERVWTSKAEN